MMEILLKDGRVEIITKYKMDNYQKYFLPKIKPDYIFDYLGGKTKEKKIKEFRKLFKDRMDRIARAINPAAYSMIDMNVPGKYDPYGPQIFGEMLEWLKNNL